MAESRCAHADVMLWEDFGSFVVSARCVTCPASARLSLLEITERPACLGDLATLVRERFDAERTADA